MDWSKVGAYAVAVAIFAGVPILLVSGVIAEHRSEKRLTAELRQLAWARGWSYVRRDKSLLYRFIGGPPFGRGLRCKVRHVLHGPYRNRNITVFQYEYLAIGGDPDETTFYFIVAGVDLPASCPLLELTGETFGSRVRGFLGMRDLQLASEEFNQRFHIRTNDDRFAYDVLHPRMMRWLLTDPRAGDCPFRFLDTRLVSWRKSVADPQEMLRLVDFVCDVADTVPDVVWRR